MLPKEVKLLKQSHKGPLCRNNFSTQAHRNVFLTLELGVQVLICDTGFYVKTDLYYTLSKEVAANFEGHNS